jgi:putative ABC transport system permease protein
MRRVILKGFWLKLFRRHRLEQDLQAELALHRELSATHPGSIPLGSTTRIAEESRDLWRFNFIENLWRDVVYGARGLRHSPTLLITAVLSLALGIGANTAIFSLAVEFLFSEPSVKDASSLVYVRVAGNSHSSMAVLDFIRDSKLFDAIAGDNVESNVNWNNGTETRPIFGAFTTKNYFTALGVPVAYGRGILPSDPDQVVILHDQFWKRYFNADPTVVGRTLNLDGKSFTIVGILPPGHRTLIGFGVSPDVFLPSYIPDTPLQMYARLKPGVSRGEALAGLRTIAGRIDADMPTFFKYSSEVSLSPVAGFARISGEGQALTIGIFFAILLALAGLVLLIACVNVAGLLLARASARKREIAIRLSLGAGRGRLLQQLLVESLLLAALGAGCGLALAQILTTLVGRFQLRAPVPIHIHIEPDWRLAIYSVVLTLGAALASGLLPAWQTLKESISPNLHRERKMRLRKILVTAQVAISLIVLAAGLLFLQNLFRATAISPGFDLLHTAQAKIYLPPTSYGDGSRVRQYVNQAIAEVSAIPGVEAAAASRTIPFQDATGMGGAIVFNDNRERVQANYYWNAVTPKFFAVMGIPVISGRTFSETDRGAAELPVVVNTTFVQRFLRGREPVGTIFRYVPTSPQFRIVGVVEGTKTMTIGEEPRAQLYARLDGGDNFNGGNSRNVRLVIRSAVPPINQLNAIRDALRRVDPDAGLDVATVYSSIGLAFLPSQVGAVLMGSIGLLGLLLAAIGLYGSMVYAVTRRTREIGVRVAVGATPKDVSRMILSDAAKLIVTGSAIGLVVAFFAVKPLAMFLVPGLKPVDPASFSAVLMVLALTGLIASWGPVRRALAIDPASCLRSE